MKKIVYCMLVFAVLFMSPFAGIACAEEVKYFSDRCRATPVVFF